MAIFAVPFYMLFNHQGYLSQYHFFRRRFGHSPLRSFFDVYANHFRFGQIILDRFAVYGGARDFQVTIDGNEHFLQLCSQPEGFMQLSSHVGNFELAGYLLAQDKKTINSLIFGGETGTVMQNRIRIFKEMNIKLIAVGTDMSHVFEMNRALSDGEVISMPGDRIFGSQKAIRCRFFGAEADFPMGPYILAASREVPMMSIFVMKDSVYRYHIYVQRIEPPHDIRGAKARAAAMAQEFACQLEGIVRRYPHQWFNYYEFWNDKEKTIND